MSPDSSCLSPGLFVSEWAASCILSFTNPRTVCALASLNKTFLAASVSDVVWAKMLPSGCFRALSFADESDHSPIDSACLKRELYFRLCRSISLRNGKQKYWLDRATGHECYILSAKELGIAWGTTPQYWEWKACPGSWFSEAAFLRSVCWFHVEGTFREPLRQGTYMVSFRILFSRVRHSYGWDNVPIKLSLRNTSDGHQVDSQRFFDRRFPESDPPVFSLQNGDSLPTGSKWVECDVGLFTVEQGDENAVEVKFSMQETELLQWKGGLHLDGVLVRPLDVIPRARERAEATLRNDEPDAVENDRDLDGEDDDGEDPYDEEEDGIGSDDEGANDDEEEDGIGSDDEGANDDEEL